MPQPNAISPYVGLQPYRESDSEFFFGRENDGQIIIANLYAAPLTILYGPSGVGKSSLLRAGVIHELRKTPGAAVVLFAEWHHGDFAARLRAACIDAVTAASGALLDVPPDAPLDDVLQAAGTHLGGPVLLVLDQFEEYLVQHPGLDLDDPFESEFARAINRWDVDAGFLVALREDWLSRLDRFRIRIPNLLDNILELRHLDRDAAAKAIRKPLDVYNQKYAGESGPVGIEDALVDRVLAEVGTGSALGASVMLGRPAAGIVAPFLQLVMTRIWNEERDSGSNMLRLATLERLDGSQAIVRRYLEDILESLPVAFQQICARMFVFLVTPSGTKIPQRPEDLAELAHADVVPVRRILERLEADRIVCRLDRPERFEVYHDALAPAVLRWRINFEKKLDRADAERRADEEKRRADHEAAEARRFRIMAIGLALCLAAIVMGAILFLHQRNVSFSLGLVTASIQQSETGDPELGLLLALQAVEAISPPTAEAQAALHRAVERSRVRATLRSEAAIAAIAAARQGNLVVTAGKDGNALVWDRRRISAPVRTIQTGQGPLRYIAANADANRVITSGEDGSAALWDTSSGTRLAELRHPGERIAPVAISSDGRMSATASGAELRLWSADGKELPGVPPAHVRPISSIAFSESGAYVATASEDGEANIWSTRPVKLVHNLVPRDASGLLSNVSPLHAIAFSPDETRVATAAEDGTARVWDLKGEAVIAPLSHKTEEHTRVQANVIEAIAFSPDGRHVATGSWDRSVRVWDAGSGEELFELRGHADTVTGVAFAGDASHLVTTSKDGTARIWDVGPMGETLAVQVSDQRLNAVVYNPSGNQIVTAGADGFAILWDAASGARARAFAKQANEITSAAFNADGSRLATGGGDGMARVWETGSGALMASFPSNDAVVAVALSGDGSLLVSGSWDNTVRLWKVAAGTATNQPCDRLTAMAYNDSQKLLACAGVDGKVRVWDSGSARLVQQMTPDFSAVLALAISPDGGTLATGTQSGGLRLWPSRGGNPGPAIAAHSGWLRGAAFSTDGKRLVTVGTDGTLALWDAPTGWRLLTLDPRSGPFAGVALDPSGRHAATIGDDGTLRVYTLDLDELKSLARSRLTRPFTEQECRTYLHRKTCPAL